jgi:hypothetical protein
MLCYAYRQHKKNRRIIVEQFIQENIYKYNGGGTKVLETMRSMQEWSQKL